MITNVTASVSVHNMKAYVGGKVYLHLQVLPVLSPREAPLIHIVRSWNLTSRELWQFKSKNIIEKEQTSYPCKNLHIYIPLISSHIFLNDVKKLRAPTLLNFIIMSTCHAHEKYRFMPETSSEIRFRFSVYRCIQTTSLSETVLC